MSPATSARHVLQFEKMAENPASNSFGRIFAARRFARPNQLVGFLLQCYHHKDDQAARRPYTYIFLVVQLSISGFGESFMIVYALLNALDW